MASPLKRFRSGEERFVTVVSIDEEEGSGGEGGPGDHPPGKRDAVRASTESGKVSPGGPRPGPQPAPRQFVTVVSVGGAERLEMTTEGVAATAESNLRVRVGVCSREEDLRRAEAPPRHQVVVFRLPGERLGLGLKFDGGTAASEKVRRLFIQSVAPDSPAARASVPWGELEVGDQILHIEGRPVPSMTRVECVSHLKEASVKLTLGVLKGDGVIPETEEAPGSPLTSSRLKYRPRSGGGQLKRMPPPPLPPRLRLRKSPARPPKEAEAEWPPPPQGFEDLEGDASDRGQRADILEDDWDGEVTALMSPSPRSYRLPPTPAVYLDLLSEEDRASRARCESESDETNSSASTVVDRLSISSSRTVSRNSSFNAAADAAKFDLARALSPFEHLEKALNSEKCHKSSSSYLTHNELVPGVNDSGNWEECLENGESLEDDLFTELDAPNASPKSLSKARVQSAMKSSSPLKSSLFSRHNNEHLDNERFQKGDDLPCSRKSNKRPAPLPPPRSISSAISSSNCVTDSFSAVGTNLSLVSVKASGDKPEYKDTMTYSDDTEICEVFQNEDFPSIIEKTSTSEPSVGGENSSLLERENPMPLESMEEERYPSLSEGRASEDSAETWDAQAHLGKPIVVDNMLYEAPTCITGDPHQSRSDQGNQSHIYEVSPIQVNGACHNNLEPLPMEAYPPTSGFFIDNVSNPAYGFPPLARERTRLLRREIDPEDELYEEVNASPVHPHSSPPVGVSESPERSGDGSDSDHAGGGSSDHAGGGSSDHAGGGSSDISSIRSTRSLSSISLSSKELDASWEEETKGAEPGAKNPEDHLILGEAIPQENICIPSETESEDLYEYADILAPNERKKSPVPRRITRTSSQTRFRQDLGQLLREELSLGEDARVEVEEEEVVESVVECETEEELRLVLRALRSDNSLTLEDQSNDERLSLTPAPVAPRDALQFTSEVGSMEQGENSQEITGEEEDDDGGPGEMSGLVLEEDADLRVPHNTRGESRNHSQIPTVGRWDNDSPSAVETPLIQVPPSEERRERAWVRVRRGDPSFVASFLNPIGGASFRATDIVGMVARCPSVIPEVLTFEDSSRETPEKRSLSPVEEGELGESPTSSSRRSSLDIGFHLPLFSSPEGDEDTDESPVGMGETEAGEGISEQGYPTVTPVKCVFLSPPQRSSLPSAETGDATEEGSLSSPSGGVEDPIEWRYTGPPPATSESGGSTNVTLYEGRFAASASQGSPPSYSRLPPDGHEFPTNYSEDLQERIERIAQYSNTQDPLQENSSTRKTSLGGDPSSLPRSPPKLCSIPPLSESRPTSRWRRQDERSERSVRDKIAMFSTEKERVKAKSRKIDRSESVNSGACNEKTCMKRSLTEDDVRVESTTRDVKLDCQDPSTSKLSSTRKQGKPSVYSSMVNVHSSDSDSKENVKPASSQIEVRRKNSKVGVNDVDLMPKSTIKTKVATETQEESLSGLNNRSQSLIDIGRPSRMKRHSVGAYDRPSVYKYGVEKPEDRERRTSLNNMIEQRRKSMSKLRGLVIPETRLKDTIESRSPLDLPRINSHASQNYKTMSLPRDESRISSLYKADSISSIDSCSSAASRHSSTPSWNSGKGMTKYSPAHNRKHSIGTSKGDSLPPLSSRSSRNQSPLSDFSGSTSTLTISPQRSFDRSATPNSDNSFEVDKGYPDRSMSSRTYGSLKSSQDSRLSRSEDSDNDSAVSSTQSSFSQSLSPRTSPMPDHYDHDDCHSPTRSSRIRHSPQSSYDELDSKRVLKSGSIEAENRRNILKSAKFSSGRSSDEQSTPEIVRKFSQDRIQEPFTDRLDSELREGSQKTHLKREESMDSSSSLSSQHSSIEHSRRNSKDSVIHINSKQVDDKVSAQPVYFDKEGDMYKESQVKVAYLNEIVDHYDELPNDRVVSEIPIQDAPWTDQTTSSSSIVNLAKDRDEKWSALESKYASLKQDYKSTESRFSKYSSSSETHTTHRYTSGFSDKKTDFRALADKWKQRTEENPTPRQPHTLVRTDIATKADKTTKKGESADISGDLRLLSRTDKAELSPENSANDTKPLWKDERPNTLNLSRTEIPHDRKFSVPEYGSGLKLREKRDLNTGDAPSRPTSLIEGTMVTEQPDSQYMTLSPATSSDSREDLLDPSEASLSRTGSKEVLDAFSKVTLSTCVTPKMSEIMRAFERHDIGAKGFTGSHPRMSSMDSTGSDDGSQGAHYGSASSLASGQRDQYGSITSLCSSTSIISFQELSQLIEEANYSLEESGTPSHEILVVVLHREIVGQGSIGITLAGGADYETKEITVHKVIPGSLADRDGRIQKGDRVLSINGKALRGVSHREALNILKSPRPEVVLVLSRSRSVTPQESAAMQANGEAEGGFGPRSVFINRVPPPRPPKILESPMDSKSLVSDLPAEVVPRGPPLIVTLLKDGAGLGFSLEGGKDSPLGDRPLTIKKVFSGGAADKGGVLKVGDELLGVNSVDLTKMARIEAWNFLKKLPDGKVSLVIRQKIKEDEKN